MDSGDCPEFVQQCNCCVVRQRPQEPGGLECSVQSLPNSSSPETLPLLGVEGFSRVAHVIDQLDLAEHEDCFGDWLEVDNAAAPARSETRSLQLRLTPTSSTVDTGLGSSGPSSALPSARSCAAEPGTPPEVSRSGQQEKFWLLTPISVDTVFENPLSRSSTLFSEAELYTPDHVASIPIRRSFACEPRAPGSGSLTGELLRARMDLLTPMSIETDFPPTLCHYTLSPEAPAVQGSLVPVFSMDTQDLVATEFPPEIHAGVSVPREGTVARLFFSSFSGTGRERWPDSEGEV